MRPEEIRIGTTYRIRKKEDLEAEFGINHDACFDCIGTPVPLPVFYWWICGKPFTVKRMEKLGGKYARNLLCLSKEGTEVLEEIGVKTRVIIITPEMLEEIPLPEISPESLLDFLLG